MMMLIMVLSIGMSVRFPRFPIVSVLIGSGLVGYVYAVLVHVEEYSVNVIAANVYAALMAMLLVKWGSYLRQKIDAS